MYYSVCFVSLSVYGTPTLTLIGFSESLQFLFFFSDYF